MPSGNSFIFNTYASLVNPDAGNSSYGGDTTFQVGDTIRLKGGIRWASNNNCTGEIVSISTNVCTVKQGDGSRSGIGINGYWTFDRSYMRSDYIDLITPMPNVPRTKVFNVDKEYRKFLSKMEIIDPDENDDDDDDELDSDELIMPTQFYPSITI